MIFRCRTASYSLALFVAIAILAISTSLHGQKSGTSGPPVLTYPELVQLYENDLPSEELQNKLTKLLNTPFVSNVTSSGIPKRTSKVIRVATWNIERGLEFDAIKAALTNDQRFFRRASQQWKSVDAKRLNNVLAQSKQLQQADIVVLNEVDWGLKRTGYRNVVKDLAAAARMNYAYGVEFVEVDPLTLGTETLEGETSADREAMVKNTAVDKSRTRIAWKRHT
jgi:hypothetical protein